MKIFKAALGAAALLAGGVVAWFVFQDLRARQAPEWPSRKKLRREARRAEAARRAQEPVNAAPKPVHVERDANPELRAPLADLTK